MTDSQEQPVTPINIGELLSGQRLQRRESLAQVTEQTRLTEAVIDKMENNRFSEISTPVYVRGYLSQYAKHLGLENDYVLAQYNLQYPSEKLVVRSSAMGEMQPRKQTTRHSKTLSFFVVALLAAGLYFVYTKSESLLTNKLGATGVTNVPVIIDGSGGVNGILNEVTAAENLANDALSGDPLNAALPPNGPSPSLVTDIELDVAISPAAKAAEKDVAATQSKKPLVNNTDIQLTSIEPTGTETTTELTPEIQTDPTTPQKPTDLTLEEQTIAPIDNSANNNGVADAANESNKDDIAKASSQRVRMTFRKKSWVKITDATGKKLTGRIYKRGTKVDVVGKAPFNMTVGSPESLRVMTIDGKSVSLNKYQVKGIRFRVDK